jgi:hypothetical protein
VSRTVQQHDEGIASVVAAAPDSPAREAAVVRDVIAAPDGDRIDAGVHMLRRALASGEVAIVSQDEALAVAQERRHGVSVSAAISGVHLVRLLVAGEAERASAGALADAHTDAHRCPWPRARQECAALWGYGRTRGGVRAHR